MPLSSVVDAIDGLPDAQKSTLIVGPVTKAAIASAMSGATDTTVQQSGPAALTVEVAPLLVVINGFVLELGKQALGTGALFHENYTPAAGDVVYAVPKGGSFFLKLGPRPTTGDFYVISGPLTPDGPRVGRRPTPPARR